MRCQVGDGGYAIAHRTERLAEQATMPVPSFIYMHDKSIEWGGAKMQYVSRFTHDFTIFTIISPFPPFYPFLKWAPILPILPVVPLFSPFYPISTIFPFWKWVPILSLFIHFTHLTHFPQLPIFHYFTHFGNKLTISQQSYPSATSFIWLSPLATGKHPPIDRRYRAADGSQLHCWGLRHWSRYDLRTRPHFQTLLLGASAAYTLGSWAPAYIQFGLGKISRRR